jgi:cytochrome d ubiquinol oxidase subunit II
MLFPFGGSEENRDQMMNSVAPVWDGNETWLVLGGVGLWVAFPIAFAIILPALYIPVILMLLALILRGVSFEFRWPAKPHHIFWDVAFFSGSLVAGFAQGVILGGLIQGIVVEDIQFAGGPFDWLTPFALLSGVGLVFGYALLGATWLIMKTEGDVAERMRRFAPLLLFAVLLFLALVSLWTPLTIDRIAARWFSLPNFYYLWPVPFLTALLAFTVWRGLDRRSDWVPFAGTVGLFLLSFAGLAISTYPWVVPPPAGVQEGITVHEAASSPETQIFMLVGTAPLIPIVLAYTGFSYWTFRGKVRPGEGYH